MQKVVQPAPGCSSKKLSEMGSYSRSWRHSSKRINSRYSLNCAVRGPITQIFLQMSISTFIHQYRKDALFPFWRRWVSASQSSQRMYTESKELITNNETGILVPGKDHEGLAAAIVDLMANEDKALALGKAGNGRALKEFSASVFAKKMAGIYREMVRD